MTIPVYQQPVNNSYFEITAVGNEMPIINRNGVGNTYVLNGEWNPTVGPTLSPTVNQSPGPTEPIRPTPTTDWNGTIQNVTANFAPDRTAAAVDEPVQFTNTSTGNVTIDAWSWQFGDGTTSTEQNPVHSYSHTGTYTVTLTASNISTGASDTVVKENCIQVGPPGPSPVDFDLTATEGGIALTVVCTDISTSSPTLWRWTTIDGLNGTVTTVGPDYTPVGMNETYNPKVQTFTFYNPAGVVDNTCMIRLEVWSPYFQSPISVTKFVTVGPPMQAEFRSDAHELDWRRRSRPEPRSTSRTFRPASHSPGTGTSATAPPRRSRTRCTPSRSGRTRSGPSMSPSP